MELLAHRHGDVGEPPERGCSDGEAFAHVPSHAGESWMLVASGSGGPLIGRAVSNFVIGLAQSLSISDNQSIAALEACRGSAPKTQTV